MSRFKIEEELTNSIGREPDGTPINEVLFTVVNWQGRNFLYKGKFKEQDWLGSSKIAECVNGDYKERFGGLKGWLKHILKREIKNIESYSGQIEILRYKRDISYDLKDSILQVGVRLK